MRVYIAGPMTGYEIYNFPAFDARRDELIKQGHIPVSPADLDRAIGYDPTDPAKVAATPIDRRFMEAAVRRDVDALTQCDALTLLEGWQHSKGARGEKAVAEWLGLPVYYPGEPIQNCTPVAAPNASIGHAELGDAIKRAQHEYPCNRKPWGRGPCGVCSL